MYSVLALMDEKVSSTYVSTHISKAYCLDPTLLNLLDFFRLFADTEIEED